MADSPAQGKERLIGLDLLRGVAVLLVLGHHLPVVASTESAGPVGWFLEAWRRGGWVGVDLFFVLSGFLVSGLLFVEYKARRTISVSRFYVRRGWKIYPPFFVFIAVTVLVHISVRRSVDFAALGSECLFVQNYVPGLWNHTWSLAVEEHFYLLLPMLLIGLVTLNRKAANPFGWLLPVVVAVCAVIVLALRLRNYTAMPWYNHSSHLAPTHLRIDSLLFGVLIAYAYTFYREPFVRLLRPWRAVLVLVGIALLAPPFAYSREGHPFVYTIGPTLFYLGAGALTVGLLLTALPCRGVVVPLSRIGVYSYSIYLWHMPVMRWGVSKAEEAFDTTFAASVMVLLNIGGSILVGIVMAKAIEGPALRLRDRYFPSASIPQPVASEKACAALIEPST